MIDQELDQAELDNLVNRVHKEILAGLPNERRARDGHSDCRLDEARLNRAYYELRGASFIPKRPAELFGNFYSRPKKSLPFTKMVVDTLTRHLYAPGPTRLIEGNDTVNDWYNGVATDNHLNSLMQKADKWSTLNDIAAIQVATTGNPDRPITLKLWSAEQICVYCCGDSTCPAIVVTIDCVDETTRYKLWTAQSIETYETDKLQPGQTSGGRLPRWVSSEVNVYGVLPFALVHYELPTDDIYSTPLGSYLRDMNAGVDIELSDLAESIQKFNRPIPVAKNLPLDFNPVVGSNFIRINSIPGPVDTPGPEPELSFLQAELNIEGTWSHIRNQLDETLQELGVPLTVARAETANIVSGVALLIEQAPLISRAVNRRVPFGVYETNLCRVCLLVAGAYYSRPDLTAAAQDLKLLLTWDPGFDPLGMERSQQEQADIDMGVHSLLQVIQKRLGMTREQAIAHVKQTAKDNAEVAEILGPPQPPPGKEEVVLDPVDEDNPDPGSSDDQGADNDLVDDEEDQ